MVHRKQPLLLGSSRGKDAEAYKNNQETEHPHSFSEISVLGLLLPPVPVPAAV